MNILITGVAGFIGFSLANQLLKNKNYKIFGIDNFDDYYSIKLKKKRISILKENKNFSFYKIDINSNKLDNFFADKYFEQVFHFAAQAGVRYSLINPRKYLDVNLHGFINLFENLIKKKPKKFFYASSSSIYGDANQFPLKENAKLNPKNIYAYTKKLNEEIAEYYSKNFKIKSIGLRFFTIFGKWGRPDMFILKLLSFNSCKKFFELNNNGNHYRDFTSINDVLNILKILMKKNIKQHEIFNICSNKPILISKLLNMIEKITGKIKIKNIKKNSADVYKTHGDNKKVLKYCHIGSDNLCNFEVELKELILWYKTIEQQNLFDNK
jgi:UDP-glucuronate 4-epimerase